MGSRLHLNEYAPKKICGGDDLSDSLLEQGLIIAKLSVAVLNDPEERKRTQSRLPKGWKEVDLSTFVSDPALYENTNEGVRTALYRKGNQLMLVFSAFLDPKQETRLYREINEFQGLGGIPNAYRQADLLTSFVAKYAEEEGCDLILGGTSLGGGFATFAGLKNLTAISPKSNLRAIALNPANLGTGTCKDVVRALKKRKLMPSKNKEEELQAISEEMVTTIRVEGEMCSPRAKGRLAELQQQYKICELGKVFEISPPVLEEESMLNPFERHKLRYLHLALKQLAAMRGIVIESGIPQRLVQQALPRVENGRAVLPM